MRLEFVRVPGQGLEIAHTVVNRAGTKQTVERQRAQRGVTPGAAPANGEAVFIRQIAFNEIARAREAVLHIGDTPLSIQLVAVVTPVTGRTAVVHLEHGESAAGPVLNP